MARVVIDFKDAIYEGNKKDLIVGGAHNYVTQAVGKPEEIEYIVKLMKQVIQWCTATGVNHNQRWIQVKQCFVFDGKADHLWERIVNRDYPGHLQRTNAALVDDMMPKMLDAILGFSNNARKLYVYIGNLKLEVEKTDAVAWTDRIIELYKLADVMKCAANVRPSQLQKIRLYTESVGEDLMDEVKGRTGFNDIFDEANNGANPKRMEEIGAQVATIQRKQNKAKGLVLSQDLTRFEKKDGSGGGRGSGGGAQGNGNRYNNNRGNGGGGKRSWQSGNNDQGSKRRRYNNNSNNYNRNNQQQGGNKFSFDDKPCELPGHNRSHKWKDCRCNYRNKDYQHQQAVRMAEKEDAPGWFKTQVRTSQIKRNGGNGNDQHNQSHYQNNSNYHNWQQPPVGPPPPGGPPSFNYHYQQPSQQQVPPPSHSYMQVPPPPPQQAARGPGRSGPSSNGQPSGGRWVFQPNQM